MACKFTIPGPGPKQDERVMRSPVIFRRILYIAIAAIIVFAIVLAVIIISPTTLPDQAIIPIIINILIHLLFIVSILWIIQLKNTKEILKRNC